jgi:DNA-binding GntR family transcriptional regulator
MNDQLAHNRRKQSLGEGLGVLRGMRLLTNYRTMQELVVEALRRQILSGELAPSTHLYQEKLAQTLGVSRQPVREALRQLEVEGYVIIEPHRGVLVKELSREDVEELYVLRSAIEAFAAGLAIDRMTTATLAHMRDNLRRMQHLHKEGAPGQEFLVPDSEFHHALYEAAGRAGLLRRIVDLEDNSHRYVRAYIDLPGSQAKAIATHRTILQAAEANDREALPNSVIKHLESTVSGVLSELDRRASTGRPPEPAAASAGHRLARTLG